MVDREGGHRVDLRQLRPCRFSPTIFAREEASWDFTFPDCWRGFLPVLYGSALPEHLINALSLAFRASQPIARSQSTNVFVPR